MTSQFNKVRVNDKYNDHTLPQLLQLESPYDRFNPNVNRSYLVAQKLEDKNAGRSIIAKWFSQQSNGAFSMDLIKERGIYNATDAEVIKAKAGKRGTTALQDAGENLLNKSYVVVFDFVNVETWDEFYDRQDAKLYQLAVATNSKPKKYPRVKYGFKGELFAYLYRVNWNDSLSAIFYQNAWDNPAYFNSMKFGLTRVSETYVPRIEGSQLRIEAPRSNEDLIVALMQQGAEKSLVNFARDYHHFRVKTPLYSVKPLKAKIGRKEDLAIDQRYFVYESTLNSKGEKIAKRMGVVRATKKITDNRSVSTGSTAPSTFYQEAGKKLYPGMLMEQMYDRGLGITVGFGQRSLPGVMARVEYNMAKIFNISMFKLYLEGQIGSASVRFGQSTTSTLLTSYQVSIGVSKTYTILRNIHLEPHVGIQFDSTRANGFSTAVTDSLRSKNINTGVTNFGLYVGVRMPINIFYNLQLVPAISFSTIRFSSNNSLFGDRLPQDFGLDSFSDKPDELTYKKSSSSSEEYVENQTNNSANLNSYPLKWEIALRYKF